jgi:putative tricarboxylic transport membrane protein
MDSYFADMAAALTTLNSATIILTMLAGVAIGIVLGALPGFGSSQALALLFPVTFAMSVDQAILFFLAVYSAVEYGSSIPAILIRTPGTGASAVTVLDGYTMARQGLARRALRISLYSGVIGGVTSTVIFIVAGTSLGNVALAFGPGELFAVGVFGLAIVGGFFGKDAARGFLGAGIGLVLATIGSSGFGGLRFTFDQGYLMEGIPLVIVIIAFLAGPEAFRLLVDNRRTVTEAEVIDQSEQRERNRITRADGRLLIPTWIRGSLLGTLAGIIPGAGGSVGAMLAYSEEKRWSKRPEKFGTGIPEGIAAPEVANNAVVAGTLVPSLSLGIPGSGGAAILLGVLISKGVVPGPIMFQQQGDFVMTVFIGLLIINVFLLIIGLLGTSTFSLVSRVPLRMLGPFVLMLIVAGAYAYENYTTHIIMVLVLAAIAYLFEKISIPAVPIVLAFIMGPIIESNLSRALTITGGDFVEIISRPITATILVLALSAAVYSFVSSMRSARHAAAQQERPGE